jgi:hypothetical protein
VSVNLQELGLSYKSSNSFANSLNRARTQSHSSVTNYTVQLTFYANPSLVVVAQVSLLHSLACYRYCTVMCPTFYLLLSTLPVQYNPDTYVGTCTTAPWVPGSGSIDLSATPLPVSNLFLLAETYGQFTYRGTAFGMIVIYC